MCDKVLTKEEKKEAARLQKEAKKKAEKILKLKDQLSPPSFSVYCKRMMPHVVELDPEATEERLLFLEDDWLKMSEEEKRKFRSEYKVNK